MKLQPTIDRTNGLPDVLNRLKEIPTLRDLYRSQTYQANRDALDRLLESPRLVRREGVQPRLHDFIRVVQWNIEKGKQFDAIAEVFSSHPVIRHADLISLNEVDAGMARSGNRDIAGELAALLGMDVAFGPAHVELTKGTGDDLEAAGENTLGLQGNAILSRYPIQDVRHIGLPTCFEPFEFEEKRFGRRAGLVARLSVNQQELIFVSTHLEVRTNPNGRARQMAALLQGLHRLGSRGPVLVAGDLNASSFSRGSRWRTLRGIARLSFSDPARLAESVLYPDRNRLEPLFGLLQRAEFSVDEFNDREATHIAYLHEIEENDRLPPGLHRWVHHRARRYGFQVEFRLDWMAGRELKALAPGEVTDQRSGLSSIGARTFRGLRHGGFPVSDHDPIVTDIRLSPPSGVMR